MSSIYNKVQWHEAMWLKAQHFQQQERYHEYQLKSQLALLKPYFWGFNLLEFDQTALTQGYLSISTAEGIFPDGTYFTIPQLADSPKPFALNELSNNHCLYLSIKLTPSSHYPKDSTEENNRYKAQKICMSDCEHKILAESEIIVNRMQIYLLTQQQLTEHHSYLAVAKIIKTDSEHKTALDENFIPSLLNIRGNNFLIVKLKILSDQLQLQHKKLLSNCNDSLDINSAFIKFNLIQLDALIAQLKHQINSSLTHPVKLYELIVKLRYQLKFLEGIEDKEEHSQRETHYIHENLTDCFNSIFIEIYRLLHLNIAVKALRLKLVENQYGLWLSESISSDNLKKTLILVIKPDKAHLLNLELVYKHLKIGTLNNISILIKQALPGISFSQLKNRPNSIPSMEQDLIFKLDKNDRAWSLLVEEQCLAIHGTYALRNFKLELWVLDT